DGTGIMKTCQDSICVGPLSHLLGTRLAPCLAHPLAASGRAEGWRYVIPRAGDPFAHPPLRAIALSSSKPAGLKESVHYRGKPRYARLVYGSGRTAPVTVVADVVTPGDVDLYLDADRDGDITAKDRLTGENLTWRAPLRA